MSQLRSWLLSADGNLLRAVLNANVVVLQNEAGELLLEGCVEGNQAGTAAEDKANEAVVFVHALDVLEKVGTDDDMLFKVTGEVVE